MTATVWILNRKMDMTTGMYAAIAKATRMACLKHVFPNIMSSDSNSSTLAGTPRCIVGLLHPAPRGRPRVQLVFHVHYVSFVLRRSTTYFGKRALLTVLVSSLVSGAGRLPRFHGHLQRIKRIQFLLRRMQFSTLLGQAWGWHGPRWAITSLGTRFSTSRERDVRVPVVDGPHIADLVYGMARTRVKCGFRAIADEGTDLDSLLNGNYEWFEPVDSATKQGIYDIARCCKASQPDILPPL